MAHLQTVSQYENAFRVLVRECSDMSVPDQIVWFLDGLNTKYKRMCATRQDGTDWPDLASLVTFALGCEARENAANPYVAPPAAAKKARLAAFSAATTQDPTRPSKKPRFGENDAGVGAVPQKVPHEIPGRLRGLWMASQFQGFKDRYGRPYTPATFMEVCQSSGCVQCHKKRGSGEGECSGHGAQKPKRGKRGKGNRGKSSA